MRYWKWVVYNSRDGYIRVHGRSVERCPIKAGWLDPQHFVYSPRCRIRGLDGLEYRNQLARISGRILESRIKVRLVIASRTVRTKPLTQRRRKCVCYAPGCGSTHDHGPGGMGVRFGEEPVTVERRNRRS